MPAPEPNSAGEVETVDQLEQTPDVGGDLPDPEQTPVEDVDDDQLVDEAPVRQERYL